MNIIEPNDNFDFSKLKLSLPTSIQGGAYFTKYLYDSNPLYIQTPRSNTRQGFLKNGKKYHSDLMFDNTCETFINWIEKLEEHSQQLIFSNAEKWFQNELSVSDIEEAFNTTIKVYKSGTYYLIRVYSKLSSVTQQPVIKIYDEYERPVTIKEVTNKTNILSILEFQGIKFTSRSFQIEIEVKQMMVVKEEEAIFESCLIKKSGGKSEVSIQNYKQNNNSFSDTNTNNNHSIDSFLTTDDIHYVNDDIIQTEKLTESQEDKEETYKEETYKEEVYKEQTNPYENVEKSNEEKSNEETDVNKEDILSILKIEDLDLEECIEDINVEKDLSSKEEGKEEDKEEYKEEQVEDKQTSQAKKENNDNEEHKDYKQEHKDYKQEHKDYKQEHNENRNRNSLDTVGSFHIEDLESISGMDTDIEEIKEVNFSLSNLDDKNTLESITLKNPNQVYFELYKEAKKKAKNAKKNAVLAYLELKNIKKTYMLDDTNDSDSDNEINSDITELE